MKQIKKREHEKRRELVKIRETEAVSSTGIEIDLEDLDGIAINRTPTITLSNTIGREESIIDSPKITNKVNFNFNKKDSDS